MMEVTSSRLTLNDRLIECGVRVEQFPDEGFPSDAWGSNEDDRPAQAGVWLQSSHLLVRWDLISDTENICRRAESACIAMGGEGGRRVESACIISRERAGMMMEGRR